MVTRCARSAMMRPGVASSYHCFTCFTCARSIHSSVGRTLLQQKSSAQLGKDQKSRSKVDYRRMGRSEPQMGTATSTTSLRWLRDLWKSPRGIVLRIEFLALAAITFSFLVVAFGSCRRWSNRWIIQKGFLAASVLSLSLGTYSIGLMQSSSVKSELYPVWAVSLFTLLPCIDPVTSYTGLDYKGPLSKMVFQICLYFGYVLLMSISTTTSGDIVNTAICLLSAITFIKGFHSSLAFVLPSRLRDMLESLEDGLEYHYFTRGPKSVRLVVDFPTTLDASKSDGDIRKTSGKEVSMVDILASIPVLDINDISEPSRQRKITLECVSDILESRRKEKSLKKETDDSSMEKEVSSFVNVSLAFGLSHLMQRHFLGLSDYRTQGIFNSSLNNGCIDIDYNWALKLIELELGFLYETFFTSNAFLHYYQAKGASLWTFISLIGICLVGVTVAIHGGTTTTRHHSTPAPGARISIVVDTTKTDLILTLVIVVSLSLLQLLLLIRCWTSNWARVAFACQKARDHRMGIGRPMWWLRLKRFVITRINWFDKYLWQDKLGQYSIIEGNRKGKWKFFGSSDHGDELCDEESLPAMKKALSLGLRYAYRQCARFLRMIGLQYVWQVFREVFGSKYKGKSSVRLHADVKECIAAFLGQIKDDTAREIWYSWFDAAGVGRHDLALYCGDNKTQTECFLEWHIATCYCELAEQRGQENSAGNGACWKKAVACFLKQKADAGGETGRYRRVAIALSKYYAYLVVAAPELLPARSWETKAVYDKIAHDTRKFLAGKAWAKGQLEVIEKLEGNLPGPSDNFVNGILRGRQLLGNNPWKVLAHFWVRALVYVAPYGSKEEHMQHLSQGGEFITHLWALLYHLNTHEWRTQSRRGRIHIIEKEETEKEVDDLPNLLDAAIACNEERGWGKRQEIDEIQNVTKEGET